MYEVEVEVGEPEVAESLPAGQLDVLRAVEGVPQLARHVQVLPPHQVGVEGPLDSQADLKKIVLVVTVAVAGTMVVAVAIAVVVAVVAIGVTVAAIIAAVVAVGVAVFVSILIVGVAIVAAAAGIGMHLLLVAVVRRAVEVPVSRLDHAEDDVGRRLPGHLPAPEPH